MHKSSYHYRYRDYCTYNYGLGAVQPAGDANRPGLSVFRDLPFHPTSLTRHLSGISTPASKTSNPIWQLLAGKTNAIRTYTVEKTLGQIPRLAAKYGINVAVGAWVDANEEKTKNEIRDMLNISVRSRNVVRIIVGNEVLLRGDIPVEKLIEYLDMARSQTDIPSQHS